jgi:hypothetical protein
MIHNDRKLIMYIGEWVSALGIAVTVCTSSFRLSFLYRDTLAATCLSSSKKVHMITSIQDVARPDRLKFLRMLPKPTFSYVIPEILIYLIFVFPIYAA